MAATKLARAAGALKSRRIRLALVARTPTRRVPVPQARDSRLRQVTLTMLVLLLVQFGLGIGTNLYVRVPARHPGVNAGNYFAGVGKGIAWVIPHGAVALAAHAALGLALIVVGIALTVRSIASRRRGCLVSAVVGLLAIVAAGFNGISFLNYGHDVSSLVMGLLWAVAVLSYVVVLYLLPGPRSAEL